MGDATTEPPKKKPATKKLAGQKPIHTVREGAIAANIWKRTTQTGWDYFEYSLSRSWKSESTGKDGYSSNFHPRNQAALQDVIAKASAWITEQMAEPEEQSADQEKVAA